MLQTETIYPYHKKEIGLHRFVRIFMPGLAFALCLLLAFMLYEPFYSAGQRESFWEMVAFFCIPFGLAAGIGINCFGVGLAKRRDRSIWLRFIVPAIITTPIWLIGLMVFDFISPFFDNQIQLFQRMYGGLDYNTPRFIGTVIFVISLYLPVILFQNLFVRFVVQVIGMGAASVGIFYISIITTDAGQMMGYVSLSGPAYHYVMLFFALAIPFEIYYVEANYPQLMGKRDTLQQPLTGDALIKEQNRAIKATRRRQGFQRALGTLITVGVIGGGAYLFVTLISATTITQDIGNTIGGFVESALPFVIMGVIGIAAYIFIYALFKGIASLFRGMSPEDRRAAGAAAVGLIAVLGAVAAASAAAKNQQAQEDAAKQAAARAAAAKRAQQQAAFQRQQQQLKPTNYQPSNNDWQRQAEMERQRQAERERQRLIDNAKFEDHLRGS